MANIIGIDLGTTMSAIAKLSKVAEPEIIPNYDGDRLTPSVLSFEENDNFFTGIKAKNQIEDDYKRVAKEFKREMHNLDYRFKVDDKALSATELSSLILKKMVKDAEEQGISVEDVVISVPAYFKETQRKATMDAGKLAGLNVIQIINEPTAAALYYASTTNLNNKTVMIYDLGGGTFDVSIAKINGNEVKILTSEGDHHLGGVDFDKVISDICIKKYKEQKNVDLCQNEQERQEFLLNAEELKKRLSSRDKLIYVLKPKSGNTLRIEITREEFEEKLSSYVAKTEILVEKALMEAGLEAESIDEVLLVGGSTKIPAFVQSIKNLIGKEPKKGVNPDEAVALGAAIKAGLVMIEQKPESVSNNIKRELSKTKLTDVANHSYGTIARSYDEKLQKHTPANSIIIPKNTPLPCSISKPFYTVHDNQKGVNISVTQGEGKDPDFVDVVANLKIQLPPNRPADQEIEFTYTYNASGRMHCIFKDVESGKTEEVDIHLGDETSSTTVDSFTVE